MIRSFHPFLKLDYKLIMHSTAIFQLLLLAIVNAEIFTVSGACSPSITRECPTLAHNKPWRHGRPITTNDEVVFKNENQPKIIQSKGPPTHGILPEIRIREHNANSLSQESSPQKRDLVFPENNKLGGKIPTPSERIKQTTITKRSLASSLKTELVVEAYRKSADSRMIISDYDGTLREFVLDPEAATPSSQLLDDLEALSSNRKNMVWLVSGRGQDFLQMHFGHIKNLGMKASYGAATRDPISGRWEKMDFDQGWLVTIKEIMEDWRSSLPDARIEDKDFGLAYHYRESYDVAQKDRSKTREQVDQFYNSHATDLKARLDDAIAKQGLPLKTITGSMVVEVNHESLSKRGAVLSLYKKIAHPDFVLIGGDDPPDEDMFQVAHEQESKAKYHGNSPFVATVHVSHDKGRQTVAKYTVRQPREFRELLSQMAASG